MRRQTFGPTGRRGTVIAASAAVLCPGGVTDRPRRWRGRRRAARRGRGGHGPAPRGLPERPYRRRGRDAGPARPPSTTAGAWTGPEAGRRHGEGPPLRRCGRTGARSDRGRRERPYERHTGSPGRPAARGPQPRTHRRTGCPWTAQKAPAALVVAAAAAPSRTRRAEPPRPHPLTRPAARPCRAAGPRWHVPGRTGGGRPVRPPCAHPRTSAGASR